MTTTTTKKNNSNIKCKDEDDDRTIKQQRQNLCLNKLWKQQLSQLSQQQQEPIFFPTTQTKPTLLIKITHPSIMTYKYNSQHSIIATATTSESAAAEAIITKAMK